MMKFRAARHTKNLKKIILFYHNILGLDILGDFQNHDNYDGVFLGIRGESWHLEFTSSSDDPVHQADEDDLWVFYVKGEKAFNEKVQKLRELGVKEVKPKNFYWEVNGVTFLDLDGFRIVISKYTI